MSSVFCTMASGNRIDFLEPHLSTIDLEDIAHGLAVEARWNGQTSWEALGYAYSVAQHSVLVSLEVLKNKGTAQEALCGLLHDAAEGCGLRDVPTPAKSLCADYVALEKRILGFIFEKYGLPATWASEMPTAVHCADGIVLAREALQLCHPNVREHINTRHVIGGRIVPWPPLVAKKMFLSVAQGLLLKNEAQER